MAISSERREEIDKTEETYNEGDASAAGDAVEALKRTWKLNPNVVKVVNHTKPTTTTTNPVADSISVKVETDYLDFVQDIQMRDSIPDDPNQPLDLKPLNCLPSFVSHNYEEEDDYETLRLIEKRFSNYNTNAREKNPDSHMDKLSCVGGIRKLMHEETPSVLRNGDALGEEQLSISGKDCNMHHPLETDCQKPPSNLIKWYQSKTSSTSPPKYSEFPIPEVARAFVDAIKKNRSCQKIIKSKLIQLAAMTKENKRLKEHVKALNDFHIACGKRATRALSERKDARLQLITAKKSMKSQASNVNYKRAHALSFGPVENIHAANFRMVFQKCSRSLSRQRWSESENKILQEGIKQQFQKMLLQKSVEVWTNGDSSILDSIHASIGEFEVTPLNIRAFLPEVNWEHLSSTYLVDRSSAECQQRWLNVEDPLINQNPWTKSEDKKLLLILQQGGMYNWINISIALGTNRTPFQCLVRYQRSLNANILKRDWTKDDDDQLRAAVETFGETNWQEVAFTLEGRTSTQCSNRWINTLNPARKRVGRWTVEEDKRLKVAVLLFGPKTWAMIAQFVPGRTQVQCRERWVNCLDPSLNLEEWTEEEDHKLKQAIAEYGHCWSKVAASVPPRTDSQCRRRWKVLLPHEVPMVQAAKKIQKASLRSNFVDQPGERPALDYRDFAPFPQTNPLPGLDEKLIENKNESREKAKPEQTKDVSSCDAAPKKNRSKRSKTEAETCNEDGKRSGKRKRAANLKLNSKQGAKGASVSQLFPEDSETIRITNGDDNTENDSKDDTLLGMKKVTANRRCSKKNRPNNPAPDNRDVQLFPEDSSNVRETSDDENIETRGEDGAVLRKKKKTSPQETVKKEPMW